MRRLAVGIERLPHARDLPLPATATAGSAGLDLCAAIAAEEPLQLEAGERAAVPSGVRLLLPQGYEGQVRPRSGLASRYGVTVLNAPGTIDSDYRGEVGVLLINLGRTSVLIRRGDRIAQLVVAPVNSVEWVETTIDVDGTSRGAGGFGSTGQR